jgi:hypothetical protein
LRHQSPFWGRGALGCDGLDERGIVGFLKKVIDARKRDVKT